MCGVGFLLLFQIVGCMHSEFIYGYILLCTPFVWFYSVLTFTSDRKMWEIVAFDFYKEAGVY